MKKSLISVAAAGLVAVLAIPASAHLTTHTDADDTRGRLDIRKTGLQGTMVNGERYVTATLWTFERLRPEDLYYGHFNVDLDSRESGAGDFYMRIFNDHGAVICTLFNEPNGFAIAAGMSRWGGAGSRAASPARTWSRPATFAGGHPVRTPASTTRPPAEAGTGTNP